MLPEGSKLFMPIELESLVYKGFLYNGSNHDKYYDTHG